LSPAKRPGQKKGGARSELAKIASHQIAGAVDADIHLQSELTDRTNMGQVRQPAAMRARPVGNLLRFRGGLVRRLPLALAGHVVGEDVGDMQHRPARAEGHQGRQVVDGAITPPPPAG
jgi:hypothetical protein